MYHRFGPFVIMRPIGQGGTGEVHLARSVWPSAPLVALKIIKAELMDNDALNERFAHEARLASKFNHPNVVGAFGSGDVDGRPYLACEFIAGQNLESVIRVIRSNTASLPVSLVTRILFDVLGGLAYLHGLCDDDGRSLNIVHRDLSPGNILVGYDGRSRISDFGIRNPSEL